MPFGGGPRVCTWARGSPCWRARSRWRPSCATSTWSSPSARRETRGIQGRVAHLLRRRADEFPGTPRLVTTARAASRDATRGEGSASLLRGGYPIQSSMNTLRTRRLCAARRLSTRCFRGVVCVPFPFRRVSPRRAQAVGLSSRAASSGPRSGDFRETRHARFFARGKSRRKVCVIAAARSREIYAMAHMISSWGAWSAVASSLRRYTTSCPLNTTVPPCCTESATPWA